MNETRLTCARGRSGVTPVADRLLRLRRYCGPSWSYWTGLDRDTSALPAPMPQEIAQHVTAQYSSNLPGIEQPWLLENDSRAEAGDREY